MTPRDTLALDLEEPMVRITLDTELRPVNLSGRITESRARRRLKGILDRNPGAPIRIIPVTPEEES